MSIYQLFRTIGYRFVEMRIPCRDKLVATKHGEVRRLSPPSSFDTHNVWTGGVSVCHSLLDSSRRRRMNSCRMHTFPCISWTFRRGEALPQGSTRTSISHSNEVLTISLASLSVFSSAHPVTLDGQHSRDAEHVRFVLF